MNALSDDLTMIHAEFADLRAGQYGVWRAVLEQEKAKREIVGQSPMEVEHMLLAAFYSGFDVGVMAARVGQN